MVILILAPLFLAGLSVAAALMLPPKYESSISILVDREETLNPMIQYNMAVAMASEDRLRSFNEIVYSRSTMSMLIDSLDMGEENMTGIERDELIRKVRSDVGTNLRASDSFSISFLHKDPALAKKGVELLADHFIQNRLKLENRRNTQTVEFFQEKLDELAQEVEERQQELSTQMLEDIQNVPREDQSIRSDIESIESDIEEIERNMARVERNLEVLRAVNRGDRDVLSIRELDLSRLPSGSEMRDLINQYHDYSQRYTSQYPQVRDLENRVYNLAERMINEIETKLFEDQSEIAYLQEQRSGLIRQLEQVSVTKEERSSIRNDFEIYKAMHDDMKVKLEQARSTQALGNRAENQFVVIDAANVPEKPAKPNRRLLVAGGLLLGIFLGVIAAGLAEILDTTIRSPEDLKKFNRPVVAFIPSGMGK